MNNIIVGLLSWLSLAQFPWNLANDDYGDEAPNEVFSNISYG